RATDTCGNVSTCTQTIVVNDTSAPVLVPPGDRILNCGDPTDVTHTGVPVATDNCGTATVNLLSDVITSGGCAGAYTEVRTWDASDACGNQSGRAACVRRCRDVDRLQIACLAGQRPGPLDQQPAGPDTDALAQRAI